MNLVLATNNNNKVIELKCLLKSYDINLLSLNDFPHIKDIKETGSTFTENALIKAKTVYDIIKIPCLADDSGLEVEYLNNRPGVYSKRYAGKGASDTDRIRKLLHELRGLPDDNRKARFACSMVLMDKNKTSTIIGFCNGLITNRPIGKNGFGYDPVFFIPDLGKTMAQISRRRKNMISHRANALKQINKILIQSYGLK